MGNGDDGRTVESLETLDYPWYAEPKTGTSCNDWFLIQELMCMDRCSLNATQRLTKTYVSTQSVFY